MNIKREVQKGLLKRLLKSIKERVLHVLVSFAPGGAFGFLLFFRGFPRAVEGCEGIEGI